MNEVPEVTAPTKQKTYSVKSSNSISVVKTEPSAQLQHSSQSPRRPLLGLSMTQTLGSTGAAITAAFLGSRLGVAGTLVGAGLASVISVVGGALYTKSLKATRQQVAKVIGKDGADGKNTFTWSASESRRPPHAVPRAHAGPPVGVSAMNAHAGQPTAVAKVKHRRPMARGILIGAATSLTIFFGALMVVTGIETVSGTALSGGQGGGLTVLGGHSDRPARTNSGGTASTGSTSSSRSTTGAPAGSTTRSSTTSAPSSSAGSTVSGSQTGTQVKTAHPAAGTVTGGSTTPAAATSRIDSTASTSQTSVDPTSSTSSAPLTSGSNSAESSPSTTSTTQSTVNSGDADSTASSGSGATVQTTSADGGQTPQ